MGIMLSSIGDGRKWVCKHGAVVDSDSSTAVPPCLEPPKSEQWDGPFESHTLVSFEALDLEEESASENATRSIFGWLRFEGYPPAERDIYMSTHGLKLKTPRTRKSQLISVKIVNYHRLQHQWKPG